MGWLADWAYRKTVSITGQSGTGTNYQVKLSIGDASGGDFHLESHCSSFPNDIQVTDNDQTTPLDYWIEDLTVDPITMWVEVADDLGSNGDVCVYYGKSGENSASNGTNTFEEYFNKDSTSGWTTSNLTVSASGDFLRFLNSTASFVGNAHRYDLVLPSKYIMEARYKNVSLGTADQVLITMVDGSASHRFSHVTAPQRNNQSNWYYYYGGEILGGGWTEGTEFIFQHTVDESDSSTGVDYRRYNTSRTLQDQVENERFALGSPTDTDGIFIGDLSASGVCDAYFRWIIFRKFNSPEPAFSSAGSEETEGECTYFFNSKSTSVWTDAAKMIDNILTNYAYTSVDANIEVLDGNTGPGTNLGTITKVEIRAYAFGDADDRIDLTPVFTGGDGDEHQTTPGLSPGSWGAYQDITSDTNHPSPWTWNAVQNLDCKVEKDTVAKGNVMYCAKVEIKVTYTSPGEGVTRSYGFIFG